MRLDSIAITDFTTKIIFISSLQPNSNNFHQDNRLLIQVLNLGLRRRRSGGWPLSLRKWFQISMLPFQAKTTPSHKPASSNSLPLPNRAPVWWAASSAAWPTCNPSKKPTNLNLQCHKQDRNTHCSPSQPETAQQPWITLPFKQN